MNTITSISDTKAAYAATPSVAAPESRTFAQALTAAKAPASWLTSADASRASRPDIKQFMDKSGAEFLDASELVYGVIGSNPDVRDWSAIMASNDPIAAARQATGQMYGQTDTSRRLDATYMGSDTVAQAGNFAVRLLKDEDGKVLDQGLKLIDAQGLLLRDVGGSAESIARNAWLFGFDTAPLAGLAAAAATVSAALGDATEKAGRLQVVAQAATLAPTNAQQAAFGPKAESDAFQAKAREEMDAAAPSLEQVIQEATTSAFSFVDSNAFITSVFRS